MSKTAIKICRDPRAVVIYQRRDLHNRQVLEARNAYGRVLFRCRHVKAMGNFLKRKTYNFYEYVSLPREARKALDNLRAEQNHKHRDNSPKPITLGDVCPVLSALRNNG